MKDEEPGGLEDEVSRMLHARALRYPDHTDPVGVTRAHLKAADSRRRTAAVTAAVLAVTGGVALGVAMPGGHRVAPVTANAGVAPASPARNPTPKPAYPGGVPSTPPSGLDSPGMGCDPSAKWTADRAAAGFTWPTRGSLAGDTALREVLLQRAVAITAGTDPKLAYVGEDATTRVAVVFVDPKEHNPCGPGMRAVVFHGPKGTAADQLAVQVGRGQYSRVVGFQWAERTPGGAMTLVLIDPPSVRELAALNDAGTGASISTQISTPDGTLLRTYAPGSPFPATFNFASSPDGPRAGNQVGFVVGADTRQALADALGIEVGEVATGTGGGGFPRLEVAGGLGYQLYATDDLPGTEHVFWAEEAYQTRAYMNAHGLGLR